MPSTLIHYIPHWFFSWKSSKTKIIRARNLTLLGNVHQPLCVRCQVLYVKCQVLGVKYYNNKKLYIKKKWWSLSVEGMLSTGLSRLVFSCYLWIRIVSNKTHAKEGEQNQVDTFKKEHWHFVVTYKMIKKMAHKKIMCLPNKSVWYHRNLRAWSLGKYKPRILKTFKVGNIATLDWETNLYKQNQKKTFKCTVMK